MLVGSFLTAAHPMQSAAETVLRPTLESVGQHTAYSQWQLQQWRSRMDAPLSRFIASPEHRHTLLTRLYQEARLAGLPPDLVLALIQVESAFQADAISSAGAVGLMQIIDRKSVV